MYSCAIFFAILAYTVAYNFDDPAFNQHLASELEDLHSSYFVQHHPRARRDEEAVMMPEKCRPRKKKLCCAEEITEQLHENEKELKRKCFKQVMENQKDEEQPEVDPFRCDKMNKHRREMTCVMECVGKAKELVDSDGNPVDEKIADFIKTTYGKESWFVSELQDKVISTCLNEAKNATTTAAAAASNDNDSVESCNPASVKLAHCLFREIQLNCPSDQIKDPKSCQRLQDKLKKHGDFLPPPPPPFMGDEPDN